MGLSALFFCLFFFCLFSMLFLPTPKKRNTEAQESRTERGCVDGIKQRWSRTTILVRFAFWVFPFLLPFFHPTFLKLFLITFSFFLCQDLLLCLLGGGFLAGCAGCRSSGSLHSLLTGSLWPALRCTASCCNRFGRLAQWCKRDLWCRGVDI